LFYETIALQSPRPRAQQHMAIIVVMTSALALAKFCIRGIIAHRPSDSQRVLWISHSKIPHRQQARRLLLFPEFRRTMVKMKLSYATCRCCLCCAPCLAQRDELRKGKIDQR